MQDNQLSAFAGLPNLPAIKELQSFKSWVSWEYRAKSESEKPSKVPISPKTGFAASSTNSETWGDYQGALQIATRRRLPGVGFVLSDHDEFTGIDLDDCINDEGDPEPWAQEILDLAETYCETTPSGHGLRLIARGKVERSVKQNSAGVEIYRDKRYLTITGDHWPGSPVDIRPAPKTLELLMRRVEQARAVASVAVTAPTPSSSTSDRALDEIKDLLSHIPPDCGYDEWLNVLMALHFETNGTGIDIADQWSSGGSKYKGRREIEAKWRSFKSGGVTGGTLAEIARRYGANLSKIAIEHLLPPCNSDDLQQMSKNADNMLASALKRRGIRNVVTAPDGTVADAETGEIIGADGEGEASEGADAIGGAIDHFDLPEAMMRPGGVVEEIADWICSWTETPIRVHALGAAIAAVGTLIGRKVYSLTNPTGSHLYFAAIAPSGMGKQHPQDCVKLLLDAVASDLHAGWQASGPALATTLYERASCMMVVDEFADKFVALRGRNTSHSIAAINEVFREIWGATKGAYHPPRALVRSDFKLHKPSLSFYGAATVRDFKESMSARDVTNGLFNRFLILPRFEEVETQAERDGLLSVPATLLERCKALYNCIDPLQVSMSVRGDTFPATPALIPFSEGAKALNEANKEYQVRLRRQAEEDASLSLYGRYAEQIKRIAMVVACGRSWSNVHRAEISESDMHFAEGLVKWSTEQFVLMVRRDLVENQAQAQYKLVADIIRKAKRITRSALYRKIKGRVKRYDLNDILQSLSEGQNVEVYEQQASKKGGPKTTIYVWKMD